MSQQRYTLITGASFGIGKELALVFARNGHNLVLSARSESLLKEIAADLSSKYSVDIHVVAQDLSLPGSAEHLYRKIVDLNLSVDILVNNAGFGDLTPFAEQDLKRVQDMIHLNVSSLTELTRFFLPAMLKMKEGRILQVASTAAFQPGPFMAVYYATKAYVLSFSEALAEELSGTGVTVTALCPGPTRSKFQESANVGDAPLFKGMKVSESSDVAEFAYKKLMAGSRVAIHGATNALIAHASGFVPTSLAMKVVRRLQEKRSQP